MEGITNLPLAFCIPFAGLLLSIAVFPLVKAEWWEKNQPIVVAIWSVLFVIPFAIAYGPSAAVESVLECIIDDYLGFIVLLFGLFCVAGNITIEGDLAGSPRVNVLLLAVGTLLSSIFGTTGSSMLLIRPIIKMNAWRKRKAQIMIFFIFLVSNIGGCLTPVGDPPLLMGFSRGIPFFWSLHMIPLLLFNMVLLLFTFYHIDRRNYCRDIAEGLHPDIKNPGSKISITGLHNVLFILCIVLAVVLSGMLPSLSIFQNAAGEVIGIPIYKEVSLSVPEIIELVIILLSAWLSFKTTPKEVRVKNHFTWGAIKEVAILFVGIFITMKPALLILQGMGSTMHITESTPLFWMTGSLSSFLDNTPTYLVFLTMTGAAGLSSGIVTSVGRIPEIMLMQISSGAVFMGANTYIGNAPNFMVKAIADENGIKMPSFFGYIGWSLAFLIPVFLLDTLIFFL